MRLRRGGRREPLRNEYAPGSECSAEETEYQVKHLVQHLNSRYYNLITDPELDIVAEFDEGDRDAAATVVGIEEGVETGGGAAIAGLSAADEARGSLELESMFNEPDDPLGCVDETASL